MEVAENVSGGHECFSLLGKGAKCPSPTQNCPTGGRPISATAKPRSRRAGGWDVLPMPPAFPTPQVQTLHLLLCRSFQLQYLLLHPEEQDWVPSGLAPREPGRLLGAPSAESRVVWESLSPEEVSQNVNALVSFRRLPCPADFGSSLSVVRGPLACGSGWPPTQSSGGQPPSSVFGREQAQDRGWLWKPGSRGYRERV